MNMNEIWKYDLRKGSTDHPRNGACLFDAGMWLVYGKIGDNPPCSCPIIRDYAIRLNDSMSDNQRQRLKPFILRVVGNRDREAEPARCHYLALETARRVVPLAYDLYWPELAAHMRALPDDATYAQIWALMIKAKAIVVEAYSIAHSIHYTTVNVNFFEANAAAYAAIYAAIGAYSAVYSETFSAIEAAYSHTYFDPCYDGFDERIAILDGVLRIGKQAPEFDEEQVSAAVTRFMEAANA